ncbi:unnamed protein product [Fraxinus pennsylvanica]|uniref:Pentatricopeptide repeat-containing protein n=1 Tax=Fraxinus pennsylvanica TaxID=56036 RepID=A0AAD2A7L4_9LAMI|nr:unnamed protein product [Fraxinus pennsylvanica]
MFRKNPLLDRIFEILRAHDESAVDSALSRFNLHLAEALVLDNYMKRRYVHKVRFYNTLVIGYAVAGKSEVALELFGRMRFQGMDLDTFAYHVLLNSLVEEGYFDVVEMVAKQIRVQEIQNEVTNSIMMKSFCKQNELERAENYLRGLVGDNGMGLSRAAGVDLDTFAYHVLLNSLVEEGYFDVVEMVAKRIRVQAIQNEVTNSIMMKSYCKQTELERAENYLRGNQFEKAALLVGDIGMGLMRAAVGIFVDAVCKDYQFEKAALLIEEFHKMNLVSMEYAYSVWIRDLVNAGKLDGALEFLKDKQSVEGYVPDFFVVTH